jgi:hypothetical protein
MSAVVGAFREVDAAIAAIQEVKRSRIGDVTVYTPAPDHELLQAVEAPESPVRRFTLVGGLCGVTFGYWIAIWASKYWALVVGGKAVASWIPYTVFGFEVMVLIGSLATVAGLFIYARLPKVTMTGYDPRFSEDTYGVLVECTPDRVRAAADALRRSGAVEVHDAE